VYLDCMCVYIGVFIGVLIGVHILIFTFEDTETRIYTVCVCI